MNILASSSSSSWLLLLYSKNAIAFFIFFLFMNVWRECYIRLCRLKNDSVCSRFIRAIDCVYAFETPALGKLVWGKREKFRLINVAWNSFRSNRNCVLFFSSTWWCRQRLYVAKPNDYCCCCCFCVSMFFWYWNGWCLRYFTFWIINFRKLIDFWLLLDSVCALLFMLPFCTLPIAVHEVYVGERKLQILYRIQYISIGFIVHRLWWCWCLCHWTQKWSMCKRRLPNTSKYHFKMRIFRSSSSSIILFRQQPHNNCTIIMLFFRGLALL